MSREDDKTRPRTEALVETDIQLDDFRILSARERRDILSEADNPANLLKQICINALPGVEFNDLDLEDAPSVLIIGAWEEVPPTDRLNATPLGPTRIASFLMAAGVRADVFDISSRTYEELYTLLNENKYDMVGFSILGPTLGRDLQLVSDVRSLQPEAILLGGGHVPTADPRLFDHTDLDAIAVGYGEDPTLNLILKGDEISEEAAAGLWFKNALGEMEGTYADPPSMRDLHIYTALYRPEIGFAGFSGASRLYNNYDSSRVNVIRLHGQGVCPRSCKYCSACNFLQLASGPDEIVPYVALTPEFRYLQVQNAINKLENVETVFINDDDFFTNKKNAQRFFELVIEGKQRGDFRDVKFIHSARIDELDHKILSLAKQAGVIVIAVGVETFSMEGSKSIGKGLKLKGVESQADYEKYVHERLAMIREAGITPSCNMMLFRPDTNWEQLYTDSINLIKYFKDGGDTSVATYIRSYPGAEFTADTTIPRLAYIETIQRANGDPLLVPIETILLPKHEPTYELTQKIMIRRSQMEEALKKEYAWSYPRAPREVANMILVKAILTEGMEARLGNPSEIVQAIEEIDLLIRTTFDQIVTQKSYIKHEEQDEDFPILTLGKQHQQEALTLKNELLATGMDRENVRIWFDLKTNLFCDLTSRPEFECVRPNLEYLFFGEDKSRFFHTDTFDRIVLVERLILEQIASGSITNNDQLNTIRRIFGVDQITEQDYRKILMQLQIFKQQDMWLGGEQPHQVSQAMRDNFRILEQNLSIHVG